MGPITIEAYDNSGTKVFSYQVSFSWRINVQQLLERAFAEGQSATVHEPFTYTLEYFGYSQSATFPGYLGYELESINSFVTSPELFWSLAVNGQPSPSGIDTTFPNPGATVTLTYTSTGAPTDRLKAIQGLRTARAGAK